VQPSRQLEIRFVEQPERFGLGDAVLRAWRVIGDEPVAVLLPDKLMLGGAELLASMLEHYDRQARSMVAIGPVPLPEIGAYGCVELSNPEPHATTLVTRCVEKPDPQVAALGVVTCGRYLLGVDILHALQVNGPEERDDDRFLTALDAAARANGLLGVHVLPRDGWVDVTDWYGWLHAHRREFESGREADESGPPPITSDSAHSPSMVA